MYSPMIVYNRRSNGQFQKTLEVVDGSYWKVIEAARRFGDKYK